MFQKTVLMIVFTFAVGLVGCRSCWGPYDHCQPTFVPEAGDQCMGELYRNGSILGGMERRGNDGFCSSCAGGGTVDYGYSDYGYGDYTEGYAQQGFVEESAGNYSDAGATEPLPPNPARNSETIPTPAPQGKGSIQDYLPDPVYNEGI
ncbi:MAG: hypothetical protein IKE69_03050 [Thermoguttaceae bacterium]|nr:hypothetical protein [Thermoguttaceae bacterium]